MNTLKIGDKVKYNGQQAVVIGFGKPFAGHPSVVVEFQAIFADFGKSYPKTDRRTVIESGLEVM